MASLGSFSLVSFNKKSVELPPLSVQGRLLPDPLSRRPQDVWEYAVARGWINQWISLAAPHGCYPSPGQSASQSASSSMTSSMGSCLVEQEGKATLGPIVVCEVDIENIYISESVWNVLLSWYGLDNSSLKRRRHVVGSIYVPLCCKDGQLSHALGDNCLDILMVSLCTINKLNQPEKHIILQLYAWDTVEFWELQFQKKLSVPSGCAVRLWLIGEENGIESSIQIPSSSSQNFMQLLCDLFPGLVEFMLVRQAKLPSKEHLTAFSSFHHSQNMSSLPDMPTSMTKSYLFQELLLSKYKFTIAVEPILMDTVVPSVDFPSGVLNSETFFHSKQGKGETLSPEEQWEQGLKDVLDHVASSMHGVVDSQRDKVLTICSTAMSKMVTTNAELRQSLSEKIHANDEKAKSLATQEHDLAEREGVLNEKLQKFKSGLSDFLIQKKRLEEEMRKIEEINKLAESKVQLNIGGHRFETSISTLRKDPDSLLGMMFSGRHPLSPDKDGSYFFDRDGTHFRYILSFLRDGEDSLPSMPTDPRVLRELQVEAKYYRLQGLMESLKH